MIVSDLGGTWRRSLLRRANDEEDATSHVLWLQGSSVFVDLRQPRDLVDRACCLRDLRRDEIAGLARQEGFAGTLVRHANHFEWERAIDYQPRGACRDRGVLREENGVLIEEGYEVAYVEHWHRLSGAAAPMGALQLTAADGLRAMLLRVGDRFGFARSRAIGPIDGATLADRVEAAITLEAKQDLVDCEVSLGTVGGWHIERSTLPWRVGTALAPGRTASSVWLDDVDPDGRASRRSWIILSSEGACLQDLAEH